MPAPSSPQRPPPATNPKGATRIPSKTQMPDPNRQEDNPKIYGLVPDLNKSASFNAFQCIADMPAWLYFSRPQNLGFHNLTYHTRIPLHICLLLGLGLNFCLRQKSYLASKSINYCRFWCDLFIRLIFAGDHREKPPLYVNNDNWEPDPSQIPVKFCV